MVYITQVLKALLRYIETSIINKLIMINFLKSDPEISMLGHFFFLSFFSFFITARDDYQIYKFYVTAMEAGIVERLQPDIVHFWQVDLVMPPLTSN